MGSNLCESYDIRRKNERFRMTTYDYRILGEWLVEHQLATKSISDYSRDEVKELVCFIAGVFSGPRPCQVLIDGADRLIVPANADEDQLKMAIRLIEQMMVDQKETGETIMEPVEALA